jgi:hypothetical protein
MTALVSGGGGGGMQAEDAPLTAAVYDGFGSLYRDFI